MTSLFISASDIVALRGVGIKTAYIIFNRIVKRFNLPKERELSVKSYCEYYNLNEDRVYRELEGIRAITRAKRA
jgi:hypothetical protein